MATKILIIDDDKDLLILLKRQLEGIASEIGIAASAKEALKILDSDTYHLIICDIVMPELSGLEFLEILRSRSYEYPIIFITATGLTEDIVTALRLGAADFVTKPINFEIFKDKVSKFAEIGRRIDKISHLTSPQDKEEIKKNKNVINLLKISNNKLRKSV